MKNSEAVQWITLYSIRVYCHGWGSGMQCFPSSIPYHVYCKISYYCNYDIFYVRKRVILCTSPTVCDAEYICQSTHTRTLYTLYVYMHTAADKRRKSILCLIYIHTRPTRLRLPLLPNSRFCAHFYTLP